MRLSAAQQAIVRTRPQRTKMYLSIFQPRVVMQCRVNNGSITRGDYLIPFDTVSLGSFRDVEAGMTLLVGTQPGGEDLGRIRIRSITSSVITVAENAHIQWADRAYLSVLRTWEMWPIFPRIIQDPSDPENVVFYKDYDIPYSGQNLTLGAFPNAGPHRAAFIDGGQAVIYYSSSGTYSVNGDALSYWWTFEGGTPTGSTSAHPGNVTYATPGHYVTRLVVSGTHGQADTTYRAVSIYNRPEAGPTTPLLNWELDDLSGSRAEGGYTGKVTIRQPINFTLRDGSIVVMFYENWYGSTKQSFGGNSFGNEGIFFVGYVLDGTIKYDWRTSSVEFEVGSISELMKRSEEFSISVEDNAAPTVWYQLKNLSIIKSVYHYLRWHSTVMMMSDVQPSFTDKLHQFFDTGKSNLFDSLDDFLRSSFYGEIVSDRQGKLWIEQKAAIQPNATGTFNPIMTLSKQDWMGEPEIEDVYNAPLSYLEGGGVAYSGNVTGTSSPLLASAPGFTPAYRGSSEEAQGFVLLGQDDLNSMVGNAFANRNAKYPHIGFDLASNFSNIDIAPQEAITVVVASGDTNRRISINAPYIPDEVSWEFKSKENVLLLSFTPTALTSGPPALTQPVPEEPTLPPIAPISLPSLPTWSFTPVSFPTPTAPLGGLKWVVVLDSNNGIFYTDEVGVNASPTWKRLVGTTAGNFIFGWQNIDVSRSGIIYALGISWTKVFNPFDGITYEFGGLWHGQVGGSVVTRDYSWDDAMADNGGAFPTGSTLRAVGLKIKPGTDDLVGFTLRSPASSLHLYGGDFAVGISHKLNTLLGWNSGGFLTYGGGLWAMTDISTGGSTHALQTYSDDMLTLVTQKTFSSPGIKFSNTRLGISAGLILHGGASSSRIFTSPDNGITIITGTYVSGTAGDKALAADESGTYLLVYSDSTNSMYRSSNGGVSFTDISANIGSAGLGTWKVMNVFGQNLWLAAINGGAEIKYSVDFGNNWTSVLGNLPSIAPNLSIIDFAFVYG